MITEFTEFFYRYYVRYCISNIARGFSLGKRIVIICIETIHYVPMVETIGYVFLSFARGKNNSPGYELRYIAPLEL